MLSSSDSQLLSMPYRFGVRSSPAAAAPGSCSQRCRFACRQCTTSLQHFGSARSNMTNTCHMFVLSSCPQEEKRGGGECFIFHFRTSICLWPRGPVLPWCPEVLGVVGWDEMQWDAVGFNGMQWGSFPLSLCSASNGLQNIGWSLWACQGYA